MSIDYTYIFSDIGDYNAVAEKHNHRSGAVSKIRVGVDDADLYYRILPNNHPYLGDIVDLCIAVNAADRLSQRDGENRCCIHIDIPLRCPEFFGQTHIYELISDVLAYYTEDKWTFSFRQRQRIGRIPELQDIMLSQPKKLTEVCLWSGGLDSLAGLWERIQEHPDKDFVLFGTGANTIVHHVQRLVAKNVRLKAHTLISLVQVPIRLETLGDSYRHKHYRSRGFIFLLLGSICAFLEGQDTLMAYENGIGALNLPYRESEVGIDHSRAVNPIGMIYMEKLVSALLGIPFHIKNPFLFWTKGQMCSRLHDDGVEELAFFTLSCDSRQRLPGRPAECGCCSSCILRRQSLAVAGIEDKTPYCWPILDDYHREAIDSFLYQVSVIEKCLKQSNPWKALCYQFPILKSTADRISANEKISDLITINNMMNLYNIYVEEWRIMQHIFDLKTL